MDNKAKKFYDRFYFLYPLVDLFLFRQKRILSSQINRLAEGKLLEIGTGNGSILPLYKKHQITGIDISEHMLEMARKRKVTKPVTLHVMDGENLTWADDSFDYVVINHVLAVTPDPEKMIREAYRVLGPNGQLFIMNHFTPDNALGLVDYLFLPFSSFLRFRSVFRAEDIRPLRQFRPVRSMSVGFMGYFKLIVYSK